MVRRLPRYVIEDVDRFGNIRLYLRRKGHRKIRLEGVPWSEPFMEQYRAALSAHEVNPKQDAPPVGKPAQGTLGWLVPRYFACASFRRLDARTQRVRRQILQACLDEPTKPGAAHTFSHFPLSRLTPAAVRILRDRKLEKPEAANGRVKALRQVLAWALKEDEEARHLLRSNPARDVEYFSSASEGHHTWTEDEVKQFLERHGPGSKARLAMALMLLLGVRRSDVVLLGRQQIRDGVITFTQEKNRRRKPITLTLPVLPALRAIIDEGPAEHLTFLTTDFGKPYTSNGFGNWFRRRCDEAGLPHCSAHGLRKAGATFAAENGATEHQLMAIFGWLSPKQAANYTKKARQRVLAGQAMHLISGTLLAKSIDSALEDTGSN
ncbi:MAG: site-specific integrase [Alsobacter sp.]